MSGPWSQFGQQGGSSDDPYGQNGQNPNETRSYEPSYWAGSASDPQGYGYGQQPGYAQPPPYNAPGFGAPDPNQYGQSPYGPGPYDNPYGPGGFAQPGYAQPGYAQPGFAQPPYSPGGYPPPPAPRRSGGRTFAVIAAAVVVIAIAVTATLILLNRKTTPSTADPINTTTGAQTTGTSTAGVRPMPAPTGLTTAPATATDGPSTDPTTHGPTTTTTTGTPTTTHGPTTSASSAVTEAKAAAANWVAAINARQTKAAKALSCSAIQSKITESFEKAVNGSITITSITSADSTGTLRFSYQKTTDTSRQTDQLSLLIEGGGWKVCN